MEEVTEWRYRRRGTQLPLAEIRDDGPAEPSRYSATTPPPCRPCREPQSALAPSALDIESERSRSGIRFVRLCVKSGRFVTSGLSPEAVLGRLRQWCRVPRRSAQSGRAV